MKYIAKSVIFLCVLCMVRMSYADSSDSTQLSLVKGVVKDFCQSEFNGIVDKRINDVKYSRQRKIEEERKNPDMVAGVIFLDGDPLYIVSAFKVLDIKIEKKHATASIKYIRLAHTEGRGDEERKIIPNYNEHDVVLINLVYEKNKWKIIDPPLPRISKGALYKYFNNMKTRLEQNVIGRPDTSEGQKQYYLKVKETLEILEKLGNREEKQEDRGSERR